VPRARRAAGSPPWRAPGEYRVVRLLDAAAVEALAAEAWARAPEAGTSLVDALPPDDDRAGVHCVETAPGGPLLRALHGGPATLAALAAWTGTPWRPRGGDPRFTYYRQPFHFMGLHRDVAACVLSVITCVVDTPGAGGELVLFPGRAEEPLAAVRAAPGEGAVTLRLAPG
jgi:hypothetical protein